MRNLFVDTGGWMALADESDPLHMDCTRTRDTWLEQGGTLVTSDYVVDETLTLIRMRISIDAAERWWEQVAGSPRLKWDWINAERAEKARAWFFRWRDKSFSFTDCTSFILMRELHINKVLTVDKHFLEAGFEILP
ncbi:MAG: type II toxin-antitoxin system VapC family toxin [Proteobacteria bacterium]|nr:type II toxin-antitoxin system VapC family toxin [Pseudomonadota bacterium]